MNITLREVYQTSADGDRFWKLKECYIRGSTVSPQRSSPSVRYMLIVILFFSPPCVRAWCWAVVCMWRVRAPKKKKIKYLRVPDTLLDAVKEEQTRAREAGRSARGTGPSTRGTPPPALWPSILAVYSDRDSPWRLFCISHSLRPRR